MVLLMWWCMTFSLMLVKFVVPPWYPSTGHAIYWAILLKETQYVLDMAFGGAANAALPLELSCCDFQWAAMDTSSRTTAHSGHCTRYLWHVCFYGPSPVIHTVYATYE